MTEKPKIDKCIVCGEVKKYGAFYCSRDCWATCPPELFKAARVVVVKQKLKTLREAIKWLLTMGVNSRSLGDVLGVSHGTVCRWRIEVTQRLEDRPSGLGFIDTPFDELEGFLLDLDESEVMAETSESETLPPA